MAAEPWVQAGMIRRVPKPERPTRADQSHAGAAAPAGELVVDDDGLVAAVRLSGWQHDGVELLELTLVGQLLAIEAPRLEVPEIVGNLSVSGAARMAHPQLVERALRLAESTLTVHPDPVSIEHGDRADVIVTTTGVLITGLTINPGWADRVTAHQLSDLLAARLRSAQLACRAVADETGLAEATSLVRELRDAAEGR